MAIDFSQAGVGRFIEAFQKMGLDDKAADFLQQALAQQSTMQLSQAAKSGVAAKMSQKFARFSKATADRKKELQDVNRKKVHKGERRMASANVLQLANAFSGLDGNRPPPKQLIELFSAITDEMTQEEIKTQVETRFKGDAQAQQRAYAFLAEALPEATPDEEGVLGPGIKEFAQELAVEHRQEMVASFVAGKLDEQLDELAKSKLIMSGDELLQFYDKLMDEKADTGLMFEGWHAIPPAQFKALGKVVSHVLGEKYHELQIPADIGLAKALSTSSNRMRDYYFVFEQFGRQAPVLTMMLNNYGVELPPQYDAR